MVNLVWYKAINIPAPRDLPSMAQGLNIPAPRD